VQSAIERGSTQLTRAFLTKGILSIVFGVVLLVWPRATVGVMVLLFGSYAIVDGLVAIGQAATSHGAASGRWVSALYGVVGVGAGVVVFAWPEITALALLYVIGFWAIVGGVLGVLGAFSSQLRSEDRWLLGLGGLVAGVFGMTILVHPGAGAVALISVVATLALVVGLVFLTAGIRLRTAQRRAQ
jgi:uncharacterized membrane protein HdeD (DUF308 family)